MYELDLSEFILIDTYIHMNSIIFYVKPKKKPSSCIYCGGIIYKHASTKRCAKDINIGNKKVTITINATRFKCPECKSTFTQQFDSIDYRDKVTKRLIDHVILEAMKKPLEQIVFETGLSITTVKKIVNHQNLF
ncbi:TPA: transposase family protein [Clostridioides difficile]